MCDVHELARFIEAETKHETRATVLGHIQRGGSPVALRSYLASRMGLTRYNCYLKVMVVVV